MATVVVSGTIVAQGVVLYNVPTNNLIVQLVDGITEKRPDLLSHNFGFYKNKECTLACELTDVVSSLESPSNNVFRVYIRPEPAAGAYLHELAAVFAFSRLND